MTQYERIDRVEPSSNRLALLDILRGCAILGTLATNIWIFADPQGFIGFVNGAPPEVDGVGSGFAAVWRWLANGKTLGLLTLMFGVGMEIQRQSAARRGSRWPGRYPWRATLLFLDGLLHYLLVVEFDVLMGYAVTGLVVCVVLGRSPRAERRLAITAATVHVLAVVVGTIGLSMSTDDLSTRTTSIYTDGSWWDQVVGRVENAGLFRFEPVFISAYAIALYLLGARLFRAGVFGDDATGRRWRRKLAALGLGVGLPLDALVAFGDSDYFFVTRYGTAPLVSLGYLGLIGILVDRSRVRRGSAAAPAAPGRVAQRLAEVGRMALSCYIGQNVVASVLCYGWGFGLAARTDSWAPWNTAVLWLVVSAVIVAFAHLWLRRFAKGPVEALWAWAYDAPFRRRDRARVSAGRGPGRR